MSRPAKLPFFPALLFLAALFGCAAGTPVARTGASIADLRAAPANYAGKEVSLGGRFRGWQGSCLSSPPVARGDWMLEDGSGCLYVHGPLPAGADPSRPENEPLTVSGRVQLDRHGNPYLDLGERR